MVVRKVKEKCKESARMRREKERAEFHELSKLLPLPSSITSQLDKASIIRLTSSYLRMRTAFPQGLGVNWGARGELLAGSDHHHIRELGSLILQTLDGFVFALHKDGKIMYISETASVHLGLPQIDLTGSSIYEYVHPSDHDDLKKVLSLSSADDQEIAANTSVCEGQSFSQSAELKRAFCIRMRCVLPKRNAGLISGGFKAMHCNGYLKIVRQPVDHQNHVHSSGENKRWTSYALVAVGHPLLPAASTEVKMTGNSFMFRANLDLRLHYIEESVSDLLGFTQKDMIGLSLYQFVHLQDLSSLEDSHRLLLDKGQAVTRYYRLMRKDCGFVWIQSHATLVSSPRTMSKSQQIVAVCQIIAESEHEESMMLEGEQEKNEDSKLQQLVLSITEENSSAISGVQVHTETAVSYSTNKQHKMHMERDSTICHPTKKSRKSKSNQHQTALTKESTGTIIDYQQSTWSNKLSPTPILIRRTSDDSSSIVSSVASTSTNSSASIQSSEAYLALPPAIDLEHHRAVHQHRTDMHNERYQIEQGESCPYPHNKRLDQIGCQPYGQCCHQPSVSPILVKDFVQEPVWFKSPNGQSQQQYCFHEDLNQSNMFYLHTDASQPGFVSHQAGFDNTRHRENEVYTFYQEQSPPYIVDPGSQYMINNVNNFHTNGMYSV